MIIAEFSCLIQGSTSELRIRNAVEKFVDSSKDVAIELAVARHILDAEQNALLQSPNFCTAGTCCGWAWWPFNTAISEDSSSKFDIMDDSLLLQAVFEGVIDECRFGQLLDVRAASRSDMV